MKMEDEMEKRRIPYHWTSPQTRVKHCHKVPWAKVSSSPMKGCLGEEEDSFLSLVV